MDFRLSAQELEIQQKARAFAQSHLAPNADYWDREGIFPEEALRQCAREGLTGLTVPTEAGGPGATSTAYALAIMELAEGCSASAVTIAVSSMVAEVLYTFGTPDHHERYLRPLLRGEITSGSFALSEPGAGSDPGGMRTRALPEGDTFRINGEKSWISSGTHSGVFVVWARTEDVPGSRAISTVLTQPGDEGFFLGRKEDKMGLRASTTISLQFEDCVVPAARLLGERGRGFPVAMKALDGGRIGVSSQAIGIGNAALKATKRYFNEVRRPSAVQQDILQKMEVELRAARLLALQAAWLKDNKRPFSSQAAMSKAYSTEAANRVCQQAVTLLGADGASPDFPVQRLLRDCKVTTIYEGTSEVQRIVISRSILRS